MRTWHYAGWFLSTVHVNYCSFFSSRCHLRGQDATLRWLAYCSPIACIKLLFLVFLVHVPAWPVDNSWTYPTVGGIRTMEYSILGWYEHFDLFWPQRNFSSYFRGLVWDFLLTFVGSLMSTVEDKPVPTMCRRGRKMKENVSEDILAVSRQILISAR